MNELEKNGLNGNFCMTREEANLIKLLRSIDFGEVRVIINNGKPTRIEEIRKSIKL